MADMSRLENHSDRLENTMQPKYKKRDGHVLSYSVVLRQCPFVELMMKTVATCEVLNTGMGNLRRVKRAIQIKFIINYIYIFLQ